jgi:hypothetical protein
VGSIRRFAARRSEYFLTGLLSQCESMKAKCSDEQL